MNDPRSRVLLGVGIPLAALLFLGALILSFSRILLAVPEELAPWIALLFATNILIGCAVAATTRSRWSSAFVGLLILLILAGGVAGAAVGPREVHSLVEGEGPPPGPAPTGGEPPPPGGPQSIVAQDISFNLDVLSFRANHPSKLTFDNRDDGVPHDVAIYTEEGGSALFEGEVITGPATIDYRIPPLDAGTYYFQCNIHPPMNGTVTVT